MYVMRTCTPQSLHPASDNQTLRAHRYAGRNVPENVRAGVGAERTVRPSLRPRFRAELSRCSTSDQRRQVGDGMYDMIRRKSQLFLIRHGCLHAAALNPECKESRRPRAVAIPIV